MPLKRTIRYWMDKYWSFKDALAYYQEVRECSLEEATNEWNELPQIQLTKEGLRLRLRGHLLRGREW